MRRHREEQSDEAIYRRLPGRLDCFAHGSHMWTAPCLQENWGGVVRIACAHMCGFGALMDAAELVSATRAPSNDAAFSAVASLGMSRVLDRSITPLPLVQVPAFGARGLPGRQTREVSFFVRSRAVSPSRPRNLGCAARRHGQGARKRPRRAAPQASLRVPSTARRFGGRGERGHHAASASAAASGGAACRRGL